MQSGQRDELYNRVQQGVLNAQGIISGTIVLIVSAADAIEDVAGGHGGRGTSTIRSWQVTNAIDVETTFRIPIRTIRKTSHMMAVAA